MEENRDPEATRGVVIDPGEECRESYNLQHERNEGEKGLGRRTDKEQRNLPESPDRKVQAEPRALRSS